MVPHTLLSSPRRCRGIVWRSITILGLTFLLSACDRDEITYMVGTLERDRIELKVESSEPITAIHVADGELVSAGTLVIEQDPLRATARLNHQEAIHDQAAARLAELTRGPREETIREARARLEASRVQKKNAQANLERTREIFAKGLSSQGRLDFDETNYQTAVAQEKADKQALTKLLNGTTVEELEQASATVAAAEAQVRLAELELDRTRVRAPQSGTVDKVLYQLGERPNPGTTIAVLLDARRIFARVYVPEHLKSSIRPGSALNVRIDGVDRVLQGSVRWVSSDASFTPYFALTEHDRSRLSYLAEIDVPDAGELPIGIPLQVDFPGQ
jgi:HlyD family secretion protein